MKDPPAAGENEFRDAPVEALSRVRRRIPAVTMDRPPFRTAESCRRRSSVDTAALKACEEAAVRVLSGDAGRRSGVSC